MEETIEPKIKTDDILKNEVNLIKTPEKFFLLSRNDYFLECHMRIGIQGQKAVETSSDISLLSDNKKSAKFEVFDQPKLCSSKCPLFFFVSEKEKLTVYNRCGAGISHPISNLIIQEEENQKS